MKMDYDFGGPTKQKWAELGYGIGLSASNNNEILGTKVTNVVIDAGGILGALGGLAAFGAACWHVHKIRKELKELKKQEEQKVIEIEE